MDPGSLFWVGNVIYVLGLIIVAMSIIAFAEAPEGKPVTGGIYKILRHPYYLGSYLSLIAIGLVCKEWLIIIIFVTCPLCSRATSAPPAGHKGSPAPGWPGAVCSKCYSRGCVRLLR